MKVKEILKATGGKLLSGKLHQEIVPSKISTDSRTLKRGEFFVALSGPNFDGNDFVDAALFKKGAIGAIVTDCKPGLKDCGKIIIKVKDATKAFQDIAAYYRVNFKIPVIAVTGSNGKTTVKDMISDVLAMKYNVLKNEGTKNNHIGVPQTILKLRPSHDICVLEMGTNHKGEIRRLAEIARPTVCVMTNIGPSHLEFFKDLEGVYNAKIEILEYLKKGALLVLNGDDKFLSRIKSKKYRILRYGLGSSNDLTADVTTVKKDGIEFTVNKKLKFRMSLIGLHNVYNALAAIAVANKFGVKYKDIKKAVLKYAPASMRLNLQKAGGLLIINDSYNSNPLSMRCALQTLADMPGAGKWVVAGDMLELGSESVRFHEMVGELIAKSGARGLFTFGKLSRHTLSKALEGGMNKNNLCHCSTHGVIAAILKKIAKKGDVVLLKGSRGMRMERVLEKLTDK